MIIHSSFFNKVSSFLFSSLPQQVAERWPRFFICPSFTTGAPREFPQRDPWDMLLPGGGDISQPCLIDQLSLSSPGLYEESLVQHWDHVSKRNKFVGPIHRLGCTDIYYVRGWNEPVEHAGNRITRIFGYANALCKNLDSDLWDGLYEWTLNNALIIGEKEQHALISPEQQRYGSKDLRNSNYAIFPWTLPKGGVLMGWNSGETLI